MDWEFFWVLTGFTLMVVVCIPLVWWDWRPHRMPKRLRVTHKMLPVASVWTTAALLGAIPLILALWSGLLNDISGWPMFNTAFYFFLALFVVYLPVWFSVFFFERPRFLIPPFVREQLEQERREAKARKVARRRRGFQGGNSRHGA